MANRIYIDEMNNLSLPSNNTKLNCGALPKIESRRPSATVPNVKPARPNLKPGAQHVKVEIKWGCVNAPGCKAEVDAHGHIKGYLLYEDCRHEQTKRAEGYFNPMTFTDDLRITNAIPTAKSYEKKSHFVGFAHFYWLDTAGNEHYGCKLTKTIAQTWYAPKEGAR